MPTRKAKPLAADADVQTVLDTLQTYKKDHPKSKIKVYRQNTASIRIRIIDPDFNGLDRVQRDDRLWEFIERLPSEVRSQITMILLLEPEEVENSQGNFNFENPILKEW